MFLCYNYQNGIINEKENIIFAIEPKLFSIGTISLLETIQFMKITDVGIMDTDVKTSISKQGFKVHNTSKKIFGNRYELKIALEDKVYLETYYRHQPRNIIVDEIPIKIKA